MHVLSVLLTPRLACLSSWQPPCYYAPAGEVLFPQCVPDPITHCSIAPHQKLWQEPEPARALGTVPMLFHGTAGPIPALGQLLSEATERNLLTSQETLHRAGEAPPSPIQGH